MATGYLSHEANLNFKRKDLIVHGKFGILLIFIALVVIRGAYNDSVSLLYSLLCICFQCAIFHPIMVIYLILAGKRPN
jgi:hypothetical protein